MERNHIMEAECNSSYVPVSNNGSTIYAVMYSTKQTQNGADNVWD